MTFRPAGRGLHNAANGNAPRHGRCPTSRDFAPWRFSDAGPSQRMEAIVMPGVRETWHRRRHREIAGLQVISLTSYRVAR
jgi:hypothetical protein